MIIHYNQFLLCLLFFLLKLFLKLKFHSNKDNVAYTLSHTVSILNFKDIFFICKIKILLSKLFSLVFSIFYY